MPTISLKNVPSRFSPLVKTFRFDPAEVLRLRKVIAKAAGVDPKSVEIQLSFEPVGLLHDSGWVESMPSLTGSVDWFAKEERGDAAKQTVANAIVYFLYYHNLERDFFLAFHGDPAGAYFVEKGGIAVRVPGGEALPPFCQIAQAVGEITGFGRDE